ncbi:MAG: hypothetical protein COT91_01330 [Candidatus Doudnabacteria bacterium CG10_big_fil_rev_8_21_14_0_10_41_10]|uniref:Magnesium transporter CorA family protein n=1 Tax=Candidatus Doudnabacteria bacterium CG10_big_fil_rev_8_21_14_0_10_41_10 TaxID=1974551 RepID=A0A2H0VGE4_9BACT|nr:MAG: hypothetical protein COT91_01330 [Candidatus Doudnabacteria bacterium CG10_big_fil_rev_8_21_14_0_10_41_10]
MIKYFYKSIKDSKIQILKEFRVGSWIYLEAPSREELEFLADRHGLELGHLIDATDPHEVPRLELEKNATYFFRRVPYQENGRVTTVPVLVAIGEDFVITVSREPLPFLQKLQKDHADFNTTQKTKVVLQIFSETSIAYSNFLTEIRKRVRTIGATFEKIDNRTVVQFIQFEEILNDFLAGMVPASAILEQLVTGKILQLYERDKDLVEDLALSAEQIIIQARASLRTIVNIREAYSTILTNNLNRVMKILTGLTIILSVSVIFTSLYGMNVALPGANSPNAFWGIVLLSAVVSLVLTFLFFKNRWF